jgi:uncharacterized protein (TIGR02145 family)
MIDFKNMFNFNKRELGTINGKEDEFYTKKSLAKAYVFGLLSILILFSLFKLTTFSISFAKNHFSEVARSTLSNPSLTQAPASPNKPVKWSIKVPATAFLAGKHLVEIPKGAEEVKITALSATSTNKDSSLLTTKKENLTKADRLKLSKISEENAKSSASEKLKETLKQEELNKIQNNSDLRKHQGFFSRIWSKFTSITTKMTAAAEDAIAPIQDALATSPAPEVIIVDIAPVVSSTQTNADGTQTTQTNTDTINKSSSNVSSVIPVKTGIQSENSSSTQTNTNTGMDSLLQGNDNTGTQTTQTNTDTINESSSNVSSVIPAPASTSVDSNSSVIPDLIGNPSPVSSSGTPGNPSPESGVDSRIRENDNTANGDTIINGSSSTVDTTTSTLTASNTPDVLIEYQTPAPTIAEAMTDTGKIVTVSDNTDEEASTHTTNVLAFTNIPPIYKVGQENKIKIKWLNNNGEEMPFNTYDLDGDGKLDYVEWTVPHLSTQTFEIIFITKALEMDENNEVTGDIYDLVKEQDGTWASVPSSHTVRTTFAKFLTNKNDITIFAKSSQTGADWTQTNADGNSAPSVLSSSGTPWDPSPEPGVDSRIREDDNAGARMTEGSQNDNAGATANSIEVFPVYDGIRSEQKIATFENITNAKIYKILLTNLPHSTNTFDLKVTGSVDLDYIVDPTPITVTDTFHNTTKIASSNNVVIDTTNGIISLSPASSWSCGSALVDARDGKTYATVLIGAQCWMQQNLNVGTMVTGVTTQGTSSVSIQKYCYGNLESGCTSGGGLYQWDQAMTGTTTVGTKGICPVDWHIPTHDEFTTMERATCYSNGTASSTCDTNFPYDTTTTGWRGTNEGTTMKNMSGSFKGILPGYRYSVGTFNGSGAYTYFWSSIPSSGSAWIRILNSGYAGVYRDTGTKTYGFSVRCLKD